MPYVLAGLLLVIASVGFTFFKVTDSTVVADNSVPYTTEDMAPPETVPEIISQIASTTEVAPVVAEAPVTTPLPTLSPTPTPQPSPAPTPTPVPKPTPTPVVVNDYRNGTFSTQTSYRTPAGTYTMTLNVTVSNDSITNTSISFSPGGDSYSKKFTNSYQSTVIGQDLGSVRPARISGASLTTRAFNAALDTIRSQAAT